jgi:hypothetical protein
MKAGLRPGLNGLSRAHQGLEAQPGTSLILIKKSSCIHIFPTHTILMEHPPVFE